MTGTLTSADDMSMCMVVIKKEGVEAEVRLYTELEVAGEEDVSSVQIKVAETVANTPLSNNRTSKWK